MTRPIDHDSLFEHADFIRALAARMTSDPHEADELVQQTWLIALVQPPPRLRRLRAWLGVVLRNSARRGWRTRNRRDRRELGAARPEAVPSTAEIAARSELQKRIAEAVNGLPEPYRSTVWLRYFEELSAADIAAREGITESSVRSRLSRAMDYLKTRLEALDPTDTRLLIALAQPPLGPLSSSPWSGLPALPLATASKIAAGVLVTLLPLAWLCRSVLLGSEAEVLSDEVAQASLLEPPNAEPPLRRLPPRPGAEGQAPLEGDGDGPRGTAPDRIRAAERPVPANREEPGSAPPTWDPSASEVPSKETTALPSSIDRKLRELIRRYYEALDATNLAAASQMLPDIEGYLSQAAQRLRLEGEGADAVLSRPELLVKPLNEFPDYPSWRRGVDQHETPDGHRFLLSIPERYSNREGFWPLLLVLLGPEEEPARWLDGFGTQHPEVVQQAIVLIPRFPEDPAAASWSTKEGIARALHPVGHLAWDQLRIDQDRILVYATGPAASSAVEMTARFSDPFAGLAVEADVEPQPWVVNLEHLAILAPAGRLTDTLARLELDRVAHRDRADLESWFQAARRVRFPQRVRGVFPSLEWGGRSWLKIRQLEAFDPQGPLPRVDARLDRDQNAIHIQSSGITEVYLRLNDEMLDLDRPIQVFVGEHLVGEPLSVKRDLGRLLETAFYTGERSRLFTAIKELDLR